VLHRDIKPDNLKLLVRLQLWFVTPLKANRLVSLSKEQGYIHLQDIDWTEQRLRDGVPVKLKEVPFKVQLFKPTLPLAIMLLSIRVRV